MAVTDQSIPNMKLDQSQQNQLDVFTAHALKLIYQQDLAIKFVDSLKGGGNRGSKIGNQAYLLYQRLESSSAESSVDLDINVSVYGFLFIAKELVALAEKAGIPQITEQEWKDLIGTCIGMYFDDAIKSGKMTKEQLVGLAKQMQEDPTTQKLLQEEEAKGNTDQETPDEEQDLEEEPDVPQEGMLQSTVDQEVM